MDSTLTDLVGTVSRSKERAQDIFYRTISRQTLNTVWNETYPKTQEGDKNYSEKLSSETQKLHDKHHCGGTDEAMKTRLDNTMKNISDHMCQISLQCKGAIKSSCSGEESDSSAVTETITSSGQPDNKTSSKQVEFLVDDIDIQPPPNLVLRAKDSLKLVQKKSHSRSDFQPNSNSSYKSPYEKFPNTPDFPITLSSKPSIPASDTSQLDSSSSDESSLSEKRESSASPIKKCCLKKNTTQNVWEEYIGRSAAHIGHSFKSHAHGNEISDRIVSSCNPNGSSAAALEVGKSKQDPRSHLKKSAFCKTRNKQRIVGSSLDAGTYVQGHGYDGPYETLKKSPVNRTSQQGICIITKPGQYIVRKPFFSSNKHFFHVEPGKFINLNISDLDTC
ncbi:hypothetical protein Btru_017375 [Bulinus truncatus]|nr:hypothetical protein Btru_017375 [Bulinus truncatus]